MKVKDFIDWVRPITILNPETDLQFIHREFEFKISGINITNGKVDIYLIDPFSDK